MPDGALSAILRDVRFSSRDFDARVFGKITDLGARAIAWHVRAVRPDDLLVLTFSFFNFSRQSGVLKRGASGDGYLVVSHQMQSLADAAYPSIADQPELAQDPNLQGYDPGQNGPLPAPPAKNPIPDLVPIRAAGPSRLAFKMPADQTQLPFTLDALLEASRTWPLHLDASAQLEPLKTRARPDFSWVGTDFVRAQSIIRTAAAEILTSAQFDRLDTIAKRMAERTVAGTRSEQRETATKIDTDTVRAVDEALGAGLKGNEEARSAANIYVRAAAGGLTVADLQAAGGDIGQLAEFMPGLYGMLLRPHEPGVNETAIELPWRLIGSPLETAGFTHADQPVTHRNRTELWHTRLGNRRTIRGGSVRVDDTAMEKLRYLWSPDYETPFPPSAGDPTFSLDGLDRQMIVQLTAGYDELLPNNGGRYTPRPVHAKRLMLSALGGLLDSDRRWKPLPDGVDMLAWTHRASQGRDSYVRVEYAGFLYPFGHAATLVKISERVFEWRDQAKTDRVAALRQRFFIIVRDKIIEYPRATPQPFEGRSMPFLAIECMVTTTPDLATPGGNAAHRLDDAFYASANEHRRAFWPSRGSQGLYQFPLVGIDAAGRRIPFSTPLLFISEVYNRSAKLGSIQQHYNGIAHNPAPVGRRRMDLRSVTMRLAEADGEEAADVDYPTKTIQIKAVDPSNGTSSQQLPDLQAQPIINEAIVKLASIEKLTGQEKAPTVTFDEDYLNNDFAGGGELFMKIVGTDPLQFGSSGSGSDTVGGLATPSMIPAGLSRRHGIASANSPGGLENFNSGQFNPADYFPDAKLLGFFNLKDLLSAVPLGPASPVVKSTEFPDRIETRFRLVQDVPKKDVLGLMTGEGGQTVLDLTATTILYRDATPPDSTIEGILTHFKINLVGVIILHFDRLRFFKQTGRKSDVDVDLNPKTGVTFGGPLEFINKLKDYIPANGFSDPPDLQVTPTGITAGYSLGLPAVQCGILSLSNISLGAAFSLPFTGEAPSARFNFAERHNTFNLTVSLFGGGGFFAVVVDASGVREIEAALEFGAQIAINLGVASGSVYVKGGFYFHYAESPERIEFEGYVELGGRLSVLGLISVSLTFHLSLTYESEQLPDKPDGSPHSKSKLFGQATLVVEVEVLFFSASVSVKVEKTFAGSEADPLFIDFVPTPSVWDEYCTAFA